LMIWERYMLDILRIIILLRLWDDLRADILDRILCIYYYYIISRRWLFLTFDDFDTALIFAYWRRLTDAYAAYWYRAMSTQPAYTFDLFSVILLMFPVTTMIRWRTGDTRRHTARRMHRRRNEFHTISRHN
jgi:hypothetical protein